MSKLDRLIRTYAPTWLRDMWIRVSNPFFIRRLRKMEDV